MARPIWTGAISFGLVNVPVKLFSAVSHKEVSFHMLHKKDGGRIRQKRVCELEDKEVPYDDIAKGYELSSGRYVLLERDELEKLDPKGSKTIDIEDFVDQADIDPIYYESAYYLAPDRNAAKPYALLLEAMRKTDKVGIARFVMRTKEYLCAVRPMGKGLMLSTMLYADEIVSQEALDAVPDKEVKPREKELSMAEQLIESLATRFDPAKYKDEHREKVLALIEQKGEGHEIVTPAANEEPAKVIDLMDALAKSLEAAQGAKEAAKKPAVKATKKKGKSHSA